MPEENQDSVRRILTSSQGLGQQVLNYEVLEENEPEVLQVLSSGRTVTIQTFEDVNGVSLVVGDKGNGTPTDIVEKLGTPLLTTKINRSGLGLAVYYGIAARHDAPMLWKPACGDKLYGDLPNPKGVIQAFQIDRQATDLSLFGTIIRWSLIFCILGEESAICLMENQDHLLPLQLSCSALKTLISPIPPRSLWASTKAKTSFANDFIDR